MTIKEMIKKRFGYNLPISGGNGGSMDDSIILHYHNHHYYDYVKLEWMIINFMTRNSETHYEFKEQLLIEDADKVYDRIKIKMFGDGSISQCRYFYFDITETFGKSFWNGVY